MKNLSLFSFNEYTIIRNNLINNVRVLKSQLKIGCKFCAVVKADAYGVGADLVSRLITDEVDAFAVANIYEGICLRKAGINKPIFILGAINFDAINEYSVCNLTPTVNSLFEMNKLSRLIKKPIKVEFGLNTGMNRYGFDCKNEILDAIELLNGNNKIELVGVYSHLSTKENDKEFIKMQSNKFNKLISSFGNYLNYMNIHISNTNAIMFHKELNYNMVRCGFGLYGMSKNELGLKPAVEIKSKIVSLKKVVCGESVGYDRTYKVKQDRLIAIVPLGYYDGINRRVSNKGKVIVNNYYAKIVGRVCMDAFMIDVTKIPGVKIGDEVTILGCYGDKEISLLDYANWAGTSEYEILTQFNRSRMATKVRY